MLILSDTKCLKLQKRRKMYVFLFLLLFFMVGINKTHHMMWNILTYNKEIHSFIHPISFKLLSLPDAVTNQKGIFTWISKSSPEKKTFDYIQLLNKTYLVWHPLKLALAGPLFHPPGIKILISTRRSCKRYSC